MSTLAVVEQILRETEEPMSVRQIVEYAGDRLPTKSRTPDTVVARDLSMDIKKKGEASSFIRTSPGRYAIREIHRRQLEQQQAQKQQQTPKPQQPKPRTAHVRAATPMAAASMGATSMAVEHARPLAARATTESENSARSSATNA